MTSLYERWEETNEWFLKADIPRAQCARKFGAYIYQPSVSVQATGFGLPNHPTLFEERERVDLLASRYVDEELWQLGCALWEASQGSLAHSFLLLRRGRGPKAGGCLVGFVLSRHRNQWYCNVLSRANEVTMAWLGDLYFMRHLLTERIPIKIKDVEQVKFRWTMGVAQQNSYYAAVFLHITAGQRYLNRWCSRTPRSYWEGYCQERYDVLVRQRSETLTGTPGKWQKWLQDRADEA